MRFKVQSHRVSLCRCRNQWMLPLNTTQAKPIRYRSWSQCRSVWPNPYNVGNKHKTIHLNFALVCLNKLVVNKNVFAMVYSHLRLHYSLLYFAFNKQIQNSLVCVCKSKNFTHVKAMIYLPSAALRFRPYRMRRKTQPASYQVGLRPRHWGHSSGCARALKRFIHFYRFLHTDGLLHRHRQWHKACAFRAFDVSFYVNMISIPVDALRCPCYFFREQNVNSPKT